MNGRRLMVALLVVAAVAPIAVGDESHEQLMKQAESAAKKFHAMPNDSPEAAKLKASVKELIAKSFETRQQAQRTQLEAMMAKLTQAQEALKARDAIRDRIISRKVEDLLTNQPADWETPANQEGELFDVIGHGDTITIYLEGVLPFNPPNQPPGAPPVNILQSGRLVTGFPFVVGSDGKISLPLIGAIELVGLTTRQAEKAIADVYVKSDILRADRANPVVTLVPREEAKFSSAGGVAAGKSEPAPSTPTIAGPIATPVVQSSVPAFDDTYGRLQKARELAAKIKSRRTSLERQAGLVKHRQKQFEASEKGSIEHSQRSRNLSVVRAQQASMESDLDDARFALGLERDYISDSVERLRLAVQQEEYAAEAAATEYDSIRKMVERGMTPKLELTRAAQKRSTAFGKIESVRQQLSQMLKIQERWKEIVGDALEVDTVDSGKRQNAESKEPDTASYQRRKSLAEKLAAFHSQFQGKEIRIEVREYGDEFSNLDGTHRVRFIGPYYEARSSVLSDDPFGPSPASVSRHNVVDQHDGRIGQISRVGTSGEVTQVTKYCMSPRVPGAGPLDALFSAIG
ncbi:MAG: polysaccharide biosynthesis/export family protein, partial [Planctomycetota bacterium]